MTAECLFCSFAQGVFPADMVLEDEKAFAILDIHPSAPGHTLIIPRAHYEEIKDIGPDTAQALFEILGRVIAALKNTLHAEGFTIGFNYGHAAGQGMPHLHVHVIPRFAGDGGGSLHTIVSTPSPEPLAALAKRLREGL